MKTFILIGKRTKEQINKVTVSTLGDAIEYFAKIKQLNSDMLLSIYEVVEK